jgi:hypothetical protein
MRPVPTGIGGLSLLLTAAMGLGGCGVTRAENSAVRVAGPVRLEAVPGADRQTVILTQSAASRLGIRTELVRAAPAAAGGSDGGPDPQSVIPVAALLYDRNGATWTYTISRPLTYVRVAVAVVRVDGELALLRSGPAVGMPVVTVGGAALLGAEYGVAGE